MKGEREEQMIKYLNHKITASRKLKKVLYMSNKKSKIMTPHAKGVEANPTWTCMSAPYNDSSCSISR